MAEVRVDKSVEGRNEQVVAQRMRRRIFQPLQQVRLGMTRAFYLMIVCNFNVRTAANCNIGSWKAQQVAVTARSKWLKINLGRAFARR